MSDTMPAVRALAAQITTDWTVDITDHDYLSDSRDGAAVVMVDADGIRMQPKRPWFSQGRTFTVGSLSWNDGDWQVDGHVLRLYHTPPPHTGKSRRIIKTYRFYPPAS